MLSIIYKKYSVNINILFFIINNNMKHTNISIIGKRSAHA